MFNENEYNMFPAKKTVQEKLNQETLRKIDKIVDLIAWHKKELETLRNSLRDLKKNARKRSAQDLSKFT